MENVHDLISKFDPENPRMGEIKKLATSIKKNHDLALELWASGDYVPRLVAVLIMDKVQLDLTTIETLAADLGSMSEANRNRLSEWLMANQLMKSKKTIALLESWREHELPTLRRLYWYYQARLRWTGKIPKDNAVELLSFLQSDMGNELPEVQWTMNFTAAWIGIYEAKYRKECVALGKRLEMP
ncbi:MAG: DNA alkylation repair protein, partial [Paracoccaceae bacterium]|nr:DNA alkylation repair protein [Paracoccaceae bacterium]